MDTGPYSQGRRGLTGYMRCWKCRMMYTVHWLHHKVLYKRSFDNQLSTLVRWYLAIWFHCRPRTPGLRRLSPMAAKMLWLGLFIIWLCVTWTNPKLSILVFVLVPSAVYLHSLTISSKPK